MAVKTQTKTKTKTANNATSTTLLGKGTIKTGVPLLAQPDAIDASKFDVNADQVTADQVDYTDPNFDFKQITPGKVSAGTLADRFMTAADYTLLDPAEVQAQFGDINRSETSKNAATSSKLALDSLDTELKGLLNYAPTAANLQRQQVAQDNISNQASRKAQLDSADPNITKDLNSQRDRFSAYAEGRVPDSITDRQLELGIQSGAADQAAVGGFGAGSSAANKAGQLMSADARVKLSQYGDQALSGNIAQRTSTLVAPTEYSNAGSQISVMPSQSAGQAAMSIASQLNSGNIDAKTALASETQQSQFKAGLEQDTNKTNLQTESDRDLNQAKLNLDAETTNASNDLSAQTSNADNSVRTQIAVKQIQSSEKTFNAQLKTNTATANADRSFQAANANAGRALETATSNRAVKLQVDTTNKNMVFQDQQRTATEKFQAAQQAKSEAGANARAAMSAHAQSAAIAAQSAEADKDRQFQLDQQQKAFDIYNQNRKDAQSSGDAAAVGNLITRAPSIISAGSSIIKGIGSLFGGGDGGGLGDAIGQNTDGSLIYAL